MQNNAEKPDKISLVIFSLMATTDFSHEISHIASSVWQAWIMAVILLPGNTFLETSPLNL